MAKMRSPNYPSMGLAEAIDKVRLVYQRDYRNPVDKSAVVGHMGYKSLNGASLTALSNLSKYGLLEGRGELRVTDDAVIVLAEPVDSQDRRAALSRCALQPELFQELKSKFPEAVPSQESIGAFLQRNGFSPTAAASAAQSFRETMDLVSREGLGYTSTRADEPQQRAKAADFMDSHAGFFSPPKAAPPPLTPEPVPTADETLRQRVARDCVVEVLFYGRVSQEAIDKLTAYLDLVKDTYPLSASFNSEEGKPSQEK
jgi:hypothetical protein